MCGMKVVAIACDAKGNVDLDDLKLKAEKHNRLLDGYIPLPTVYSRSKSRTSALLSMPTVGKFTWMGQI